MMKTQLAAISFTGLLTLGACMVDDPSAAPPDDVHAETTAAASPNHRDVRRTLLRMGDGSVVEVEVEVRNGRAIIEDDIVLGDAAKIVEPGEGIPRSNLLTVAADLWPSNVIPYSFDDTIDIAGRSNVMSAIAQWETQTPFRFVGRTDQDDYIEFSGDEEGCFSDIGRTGGGQTINLENGGCDRGNAIHEIGHALGLYHEQSRSDRDQYLTYFDGNVESGKGPQFTIQGSPQGPLDLASVMMYPSFAFTANNGPTLLAKDRWSWRPGGSGNWGNIRANEPLDLKYARFGDFNHDGAIDALKFSGTTSYIASGTTGTWSFWDTQTKGATYIGVGRFDGDAYDDLFLADGTGWYYARNGQGDWIKINSSTYKLNELMLGDFDGDGQTDVMRPDGTQWNVSWQGRTVWKQLNTSSYSYGQIAVGQFDTTPGDDVLITTGSQWLLASGGQGRAYKINDSGVLAKDMILGKFDGNAITDIVYPGAIDRYDISADGRGGWAPFVEKGGDVDTPPAAYVRVADVNHDGVDDILCEGVFGRKRQKLSDEDVASINTLYWGTWQVSRGGTTTFEYRNQSNIAMSDLRFADFNNDGIDDVFRANGSVWQVAYGASGNWVTLSTSGYKLADLAVADFDGDGRADVLRTDGSKWWMSKSGTSLWVQRNSSGYTLDQLRFGDLDGDGSTDVFLATGSEWFYSKGGASTWIKLASSGVTNVALADMDGDGRDDVVYATGTQLQYAKGGQPGWYSLLATPEKLSSLRFADFNHDHKADVLRADGTNWWVSYSGTSGWTYLNKSGYSVTSMGIGQLDADGNADIMVLMPRLAH